MNLEAISLQLRENKEAQEDTTTEVQKLTNLISKQILQEQRDRMDELNSKDILKDAEKMVNKIAKDDSQGVPPLLGNLLNFLRGLAGPLGLVALAELTDTDAFLRALGIPKMVGGVKKVLSGIANIFDSIKNFELPKVALAFDDGTKLRLKIPELPKLSFFTAAGEAIVDKIKLKLPDLPKFSFASFLGDIYNAGEPIKLKLPEIPKPGFVTAAGEAVDNLKLKIPELPKFSFASFLGKVYNAGEPIKLNLPEFPKITLPDIKLPEIPKLPTLEINEKAFSIVEKVKNIIGFTAEGAEGGKGLLGFFGRVFKLLDPVLAPLKFVLKTALRPFTQIILTVVDFVKGFYDGFTGEEGTMSDKILAGIEGGFVGVIKGITEAFDLLFVTIPAWLLEKFGMQNAAEVLRGFSLTALVDPVWAGIKGIVTFVGDQFINMKDIIVGSFTIQLTRIVNGFKKGFERLSNFIANLGDELYLMIAKNFRFRLPEVSIDLPGWLGGGKFTLIPKIDVGVGTAESIAATEEAIDRRNAKSEMKIRALDKEVADMMKAQQDRLAELNSAFQNQVVNAVNNSTNTQNNTQNTVLNAPQMPATMDVAQPF